jgi:hypothetical protein
LCLSGKWKLFDGEIAKCGVLWLAILSINNEDEEVVGGGGDQANEATVRQHRSAYRFFGGSC